MKRLYWILLAFIPAVVSFLLLLSLLQVDLNQFVPGHFDIFNDAIYHWRQIYTFSAVGFNGGYYTINELPALASFSHFYHHGPGHALLYGLPGRLTGWYLNTAIAFNTLVVSLSLIMALLILRSSRTQSLLYVLTALLVWPLLIYMPSSMAESLHHAGAILLACLMWWLIAERGQHPRRLYRATLALLVILTLTRPTWGVLFIPVLLLRQPAWTLPRVIVAGLIGTACFVGLYAFHTLFIAPYPQLDKAILVNGDLIASVQARLEQLADNLEIWNRGIDIEVAQRYQVVAVLVGVGLLWGWRRRQFSAEAIFHLSNLGLPLAINLFFNDMSFYRDFRALAPHLLLSLMVLLACRRWIIPAAFIAVQAVMLPQFLTEYRATVAPQFAPGVVDQITAFRDQTREVLVYDPAAPSAWCNTLLFVMENRGDRVLVIPPELALIDPGIGLSYYIGYWGDTTPLTYPIRSRYLLLSEANRAKIGDQAQLTLRMETGAGGIYLNEDTDCDDNL
jgi:hypothetical protein